MAVLVKVAVTNFYGPGGVAGVFDQEMDICVYFVFGEYYGQPCYICRVGDPDVDLGLCYGAVDCYLAAVYYYWGWGYGEEDKEHCYE